MVKKDSLVAFSVPRSRMTEGESHKHYPLTLPPWRSSLDLSKEVNVVHGRQLVEFFLRGRPGSE